MADKTVYQRKMRYQKRLREQGYKSITTLVAPEIKAQLEALLKDSETGSYNEVFQKLLDTHQQRAA